MASTLIIGIGTTGLNIIEEAQQFHYEFTGRNKPGDNVEYIYVETDISKKPRKTATGTTDIEQIEFGLGGNAVDINQLKANKSIDSHWVPDATAVLQNLSGAGGMPSYGRLALWGSANYRKFKETIKDKYERIRGNDDTQIFIVGSLTGGTGSGLCVDIAYLVKDITKNPNINALLLLPDGSSFGSNKALHENSFSALAAITHYTKPENNYKATWPDGSSTTELGPPFQFVQFLSQDFTGAKASISTLGELIKVAGTITALHIIDTEKPGNYFYNLVSSRRVDSVGNDRIQNMISGGFYMIQFPKAQLEEMLAIQVSTELLDTLIHEKEYIDKFGNRKEIKGEETNIRNKTRLEFEEILQSCLGVIDGISFNGSNLLQCITAEVDKVLKKNHGKDTNKRFFYDLFSTKHAGNYFELIKNNGSLIKDNLIDKLYRYIADTTSQYKNLHVSKFALKEIRVYITQIVDFYAKQYKITGADADWDKLLQRTLDHFEQESAGYNLIGQKKSYLEFELQQIADLAKLHVLIPILVQLQQDLIDSPISIRSKSGNDLPNEKTINSMIETVGLVTHGDGSEGNYTMKRRNNEINNILDRFSSCFKMVYAKGSKESDLDAAYNKYLQDKKIGFDNLFLNDSIWAYLNSKKSDLYSDCITNSTRFIKTNKYFDSSTLKDILAKLHPDTLPNKALLDMLNQPEHKIKESVPSMVKLKAGAFAFGHDPSAKLVILTNDHKSYNELFNVYKAAPINSNTADIPSLNDTIIFYQEYGYMGDVEKPHFSPLIHIGYMDDVKSHLKPILNEEFKKKKIPYLSIEQLKKITNDTTSRAYKEELV